MLIGEICRLCNLTKKAVEYHEQQGFIKPEISPNGYRIYTETDSTLLREIALLRTLDLSIPEIRAILHDKIDSAEKAAAFDQVINFLDHIESIEIPEDLDDLFSETYYGMDAETLESNTLDTFIALGKAATATVVEFSA